jgi:hypothetical protein
MVALTGHGPRVIGHPLFLLLFASFQAHRDAWGASLRKTGQSLIA